MLLTRKPSPIAVPKPGPSKSKDVCAIEGSGEVVTMVLVDGGGGKRIKLV